MQIELIIWIILAILSAFYILLLLENVIHLKRLKTIPLRISVSGTRGKTSITRMLASILRESGRNVLAKTTGTEAVYILPDGSIENIKRRGPTNIIEQKNLIIKASQLKADVLISEVMSIQAENHKIESRRLIKPNYTIIANMNPDHLDAAPGERMSILYENDLYRNSTLVIPENVLDKRLEIRALQIGCTLMKVEQASFTIQNKLIASALAKRLGCTAEQIAMGLKNAQMDLGATLAYSFKQNGQTIIFINAFAANDPVSSQQIIEEISSQEEYKNYELYAILNLRNDRPERSVQWIDFLKGKYLNRFKEIYLIGDHGRAAKRQLKQGRIIKNGNAEQITNMLLSTSGSNYLVFGLVNIAGIGSQLIEYWANNGTKLDLLNTK